jgi:hypothetical protein
MTRREKKENDTIHMPIYLPSFVILYFEFGSENFRDYKHTSNGTLEYTKRNKNDKSNMDSITRRQKQK